MYLEKRFNALFGHHLDIRKSHTRLLYIQEIICLFSLNLKLTEWTVAR